jgi:hypothetical protein
MALDALGADPCSLLNRTGGYADLWLEQTGSDAANFPRIANAGVLRTYLSYLTALNSGAGLDGHLLRATGQNPNSTFPLLQFLSGGGSTDASVDYRMLKNVVLRTSTNSAPQTIVDTYIVGSSGLNKGSAYTYSTATSKIVTDSNIWTASDQAADGSIIANPSSLLGRLLAAGYLISRRELFNPAEFQPGAATPPVGRESLVYLYKLTQESSSSLSSQQSTRKLTLEIRNQRFFGAFLAEYCFYRTRYEWLLQKYFDVYTKQATTGANVYMPPGAGSTAFNIFIGTGAGENQYRLVNGSLTQQDYLKGLAYQMACLNTRMTDMRRILSAINTYYTGIFTTIRNQLNDGSLLGSNADLTRKITALNTSSKEADKYLTQAEFSKGVMEYNLEKNRNSNILLGLYAFLNITALATIFQLSRAS